MCVVVVGVGGGEWYGVEYGAGTYAFVIETVPGAPVCGMP